MSVKINYSNSSSKKNSSNLILFSDENYNISGLKNYISSSEYSFIADLIKTKDLKKKILSFDVSSKRKIVLISLKKNIKNSEVENIGAKFYDLFKDFKRSEYTLNSNTISKQLNRFVGHFLHGLKLKSYRFEKYKSKKNNKNIVIDVVGKNQTTNTDQFKFNLLGHLEFSFVPL